MEQQLPTIVPYSWADVDSAINKSLQLLSDFGVDAILGLAVGGIIPATILANRLNKNLYILDPAKPASFHYNDGCVLVVSDLDGSTIMQSVVSKLNFHNAVLQSNYQSRLVVKTLSLHVREKATFKPDVVLDPTEIPQTAWVRYPWE